VAKTALKHSAGVDSTTEVSRYEEDDAHVLAFESKLKTLPPEVGALLVAIGVAGILLPGPVGSPFLIAGGVALWPGLFGRIETWYRHRFPRSHRHGMVVIERFIADMEKRYPTPIA
jgi:hypothetical protein